MTVGPNTPTSQRFSITKMLQKKKKMKKQAALSVAVLHITSGNPGGKNKASQVSTPCHQRGMWDMQATSKAGS